MLLVLSNQKKPQQQLLELILTSVGNTLFKFFQYYTRLKNWRMSSIIWVIKLPLPNLNIQEEERAPSINVLLSAGNWIKGEMLRIYWQLEFPLIIAVEINEWHFQSLSMSPHMTMLGHPSHKLYTVIVVVGQHHRWNNCGHEV